MKITESILDEAFTTLLAQEKYPHSVGNRIVEKYTMELAESEVLNF